MKKIFFLFVMMLLITASFFFYACTGDKKGEDQTKNVAPKVEEPLALASGEKTCCFMKEGDFYPFFPIPKEGDLTVFNNKTHPSASINCGEENRLSLGNLIYRIKGNNIRELHLRIFDYCNRNNELKQDYERRKKNYSNDKKASLTYLEKKGVYEGFTYTVPKQQVYLVAMVDGRFKVQIQATTHDNLEMTMKLFEMIPLEKLAMFKK